MFCYGLLFTPSGYPLCPSWQERAVPARLCDSDGYLQSTANTALAEAGHRAAVQSSWTPERNHLWSVKELVPGSEQQGWDCTFQPLKGELQRNIRVFLRQVKSCSHVPNQGPFIDPNFWGPMGYWDHSPEWEAAGTSGVKGECPGISLPLISAGKIPLQRSLRALHLPASIPHSSPWHLPSAPASDRPLPYDTGSLHGTSSSSPFRNHSPAQLLYMGRIRLSRSPVRQTSRQTALTAKIKQKKDKAQLFFIY